MIILINSEYLNCNPLSFKTINIETDIKNTTNYGLTFKPLACINQTTLEYDEPKIFQSRISFLACNIKTCCSLS